uniref:Dephospho-CoA kinase domain-containing protein n=2 Tax=Callithrix jacchus TaxID=9483 RepID=A0A8I3ZZ47_CALJA
MCPQPSEWKGTPTAGPGPAPPDYSRLPVSTLFLSVFICYCLALQRSQGARLVFSFGYPTGPLHHSCRAEELSRCDPSAPGSAVSGHLFPGKMFLVGLTGGIASGKSSVIQVFQQLGCAVIDVDVMARHVVQPGYPAHRRIVEVFGTEVLLENGDINRKVLGDLIFNQPDRRQLLNAITHPEIRKEMMKETFKYFLRGYRYVILDIPLLFETKKLLKYMKHTVVVYCDRDTQLVRLMRRNRLNRKDAEARINAQLPLTEKAHMARHVLDNSDEWSVTKLQVILLHAELERSLEYLPLRLGVLTGLAGIAILLYLLTHYLLPYA